MCIDWHAEVNASAVWLVPIEDDAELTRWRERLRAGLCGRAPL